MLVPSFESLTTFSGIFVFCATLALWHRRYTVGATLLIIAGAGGVGIFWDRWSRDAGPHVQVQALFSSDAPSGEQLILLGTHFPLLVLGLVILAISSQRFKQEVRTNDHVMDLAEEAPAGVGDHEPGRRASGRDELRHRGRRRGNGLYRRLLL
jgi:hypothetical protein